MRRSRLIQLRASRSDFSMTLALAALLLIAGSSTGFAQDAGKFDELPGFSQVSELLYRGAQPRPGGLQLLVEMDIVSIINLRGPGKETRAEEAEAAALGLRYFNVSMPTWGRPPDSAVSKVLEIISDPDNGRVFIHCKDGVDRTGMVIALYRINSEGWTATSALAEARSNGMRRTQVWMRDYIEDYYHRRQLTTRSALVSGHVYDERDFGDTLGAYARVGEQFTFKATKVAKRVFRRIF